MVAFNKSCILGNFGFRQYSTEGTDLTAPANGKINGWTFCLDQESMARKRWSCSCSCLIKSNQRPSILIYLWLKFSDLWNNQDHLLSAIMNQLKQQCDAKAMFLFAFNLFRDIGFTNHTFWCFVCALLPFCFVCKSFNESVVLLSMVCWLLTTFFTLLCKICANIFYFINKL